VNVAVGLPNYRFIIGGKVRMHQSYGSLFTIPTALVSAALDVIGYQSEVTTSQAPSQLLDL
jgi:hypothetical protein